MERLLTSNGQPRYRGRFAPTPSGPLHFGSLVAATASYADALAHGGEWLLRIEDLDPPRVVRGASEQIQETLHRLGFVWHGSVIGQSTRTGLYAAALRVLDERGLVYGCSCSRKDLESQPHRGFCQTNPRSNSEAAMRFQAGTGHLVFEDLVQGEVVDKDGLNGGDFVLRRADGVYSYHLAVVVDDADQRITDVIRGADLLDSTGRHILLQRALNLPSPGYLHVPAVIDARGEKLSKQTHAPALDASRASKSLVQALAFLGQRPPEALATASPPRIWEWAAEHWDRKWIPRVRTALAGALD